MMKKLLLTALLCLTACFLTGCAEWITGIEDLMSPPTINEDQYGIYSLLAGDGAVPDFIFPERGDLTDPIYVADINGDGKRDGVAFCSDPESGGCTISFMEHENGQWKLKERYRNTAGQVDKVLLADITGDGIKEIIVGWGSWRSMAATVCVYSYQDTAGRRGVFEYSLGYTYGDMLLTDFTDDGIAELCTVTVHTTSGSNQAVMSNAIARVYTFSREEPYCAYAINLSKEVKEYCSFSFGTADCGRKMLVIDGLTDDDRLVTQLLVLSNDGSGLIAPLLYSDMRSSYNHFSRPAELKVTARDIDGDGFIEIPFARLMPGLDGDSSSDYMVSWLDYRGSEGYFETSLSTIVNTVDGYYLTVRENADSIAVIHSDNGKFAVNFVRNTESEQLTELSTLFTLYKFDPQKVSLDQIRDYYFVLDILQDGCIIAMEYDENYENVAWVKEIARSYAPINEISY